MTTFFEIYNNPIKNKSTILNVKDGSVFELSNYFKSKRVDIQESKNLQIGLRPQGNHYELYIGQYNIKVFSGRFPVLDGNVLLFEHELRIKGILYVDGGILIQVRCNCWGMFNIELPMYMEQVIFVDTSKGYLSNGYLVAVTYTPFMIYNKKDLNSISKVVINMPRHKCYSGFLDLSYCKIRNEINFYGYRMTPQMLMRLAKPINILDNMVGV